MFMNTRGICVYSYNGIASGSVAEWNRERQRSEWNRERQRSGILQCCVARNV